jgi:hypothetical protein
MVAPGSYAFMVTAANAIGTSDPLQVVIVVTGTAQAFQFVGADPTLVDMQIDVRTGVVTSKTAFNFKQYQNARIAMIFSDTGTPVAPPDVSTLTLGIRPLLRYDAGYVIGGITFTLVVASGGNPAYVLATFVVDSPELEAQLNSIIATLAAGPATSSTLPTFPCMADVTWTSSGGVKQASQTFDMAFTPAVTD